MELDLVRNEYERLTATRRTGFVQNWYERGTPETDTTGVDASGGEEEGRSVFPEVPSMTLLP